MFDLSFANVPWPGIRRNTKVLQKKFMQKELSTKSWTVRQACFRVESLILYTDPTDHYLCLSMT
jgi:hypothetical protein